MIRRHPRSTLSSSSAASDVYKRQELLLVRNEASVEIDVPFDHLLNKALRTVPTVVKSAWVYSQVAHRIFDTYLPSLDMWHVEPTFSEHTLGVYALEFCNIRRERKGFQPTSVPDVSEVRKVNPLDGKKLSLIHI
eukprot:TRINITY_DN24114_c0_g2_i1.p1 TRINITY_DN24114_c0_g2~~TRINITY_DN24114_c0_g2_i1.p1  ORF type:complete len:135 (+),score=2.74 TRINITY_DN24114_c0_g2_i1:1-405(+)